MSVEKKKAKVKKPDKYDMTLKLDCTFDEAMQKIAQAAEKKMKERRQKQ